MPYLVDNPKLLELLKLCTFLKVTKTSKWRGEKGKTEKKLEGV